MKKFFKPVVDHPIKSIISLLLVPVAWRLSIGGFFIPLFIYIMWEEL